MGIYPLNWKDISSHNIGITYPTYHGNNLPWLATYHRIYLYCMYHRSTLTWFSEFHGASLLWLVSPIVHLYATSLNKILWDGNAHVLGSDPAQVCIWGVLRDYLNLSSELTEGSPLQWFGKVIGQHLPNQEIFDLQVPHHYPILNLGSIWCICVFYDCNLITFHYYWGACSSGCLGT